MASVVVDDDRFVGVELSSIFLLSFGRACVNLQALTGGELDHLLAGVEESQWVDAAVFFKVLALVESRFANFEPILERIGAEMMKLWYEFGPGRSIVRKAVDFLHFQTGSGGYASVVRGPGESTGSFSLASLDEESGTAVVRSTTPFSRAMERGVLLGGLQLSGDALYVDVNNSTDPNEFHISFH